MLVNKVNDQIHNYRVINYEGKVIYLWGMAYIDLKKGTTIRSIQPFFFLGQIVSTN